MIWSGWNTSYWRWEEAREETDRESKRGPEKPSSQAPEARTYATAQLWSTWSGCCAEDSVQLVYKVRAEMQDWVSMYMVKEEHEIGTVGRRKWW